MLYAFFVFFLFKKGIWNEFLQGEGMLYVFTNADADYKDLGRK